MANRKVFANNVKASSPAATAVNNAGGRAYDLGAKHTLAQLACTGTFSNTFYVKAEDMVDQVLDLAKKCEPLFVAQVAVYARKHAFMKDMPAYLVAYLSTVDSKVFRDVFPIVIDNGKMLRNFVQIMRSGKVGRTSLGHAPKAMVQLWLESNDDEAVFRASIGNDPSLKDIISLARPRPMTLPRAALYAHLLDRKKGHFNDREFIVADNLPSVVSAYENYRRNPTGELPRVPFEMLTGLTLDESGWKQIAERASWTQTRMNLATFERHGVFKDKSLVKLIAGRLRDEAAIKKANVFPYQLMMAYTATEGGAMPREITMALQDAMEIATENVPSIEGDVFVFPDISGSMDSAVTGERVGSTTKVTCRMVAALVAATMMRKNPSGTVVWPFESKVITDVNLNPRDSIMTNAKKLSELPCGGTDCSAPLKELNRRGAKVDLVLYVSDNESWLDSPRYGQYAGNRSHWGSVTPQNARTDTLNTWDSIRKRNPKAKLVCLDITPTATSQTINRADVLNIGGFSDQVFQVVDAFNKATDGASWVSTIEKIII